MPDEKKEDTMRIGPLAELTLQPLTDEQVALLLTDRDGKISGYVITPDGLNAILGPLLGLVQKWAHLEGPSTGKHIGPRMALPASRVVVEQGRNTTECALRVFVGKVEFSFLLPLQAVVDGMAALIPRNKGEQSH
jgi:hypothetical protein